MLPRHFFHELRTAAHETRHIAGIPVAVTLLVIVVWQTTWLRFNTDAGVGYNMTRDMIIGVLDNHWAYVGWLVPYFMLKQPELHDGNALWRTAPVGKWTVFGSRITFTFVMTVLLPATVMGLFCLGVFPAIAAEQANRSLWYQTALFAIGAFAAFSSKGYRGLWFTTGLGVLWFVINLVGEEAAQWVLHHQVLDNKNSRYQGDGDYIGISDSWPRVVPWIAIPTVIAVWMPFIIHRARRTSRVWLWILVVAGAAVACQAALFLSPYMKPTYAAKTLPVLKATSEKGSADASYMTAPGTLIRLTENHVSRGALHAEIRKMG